jgi:hypothetical protein
MSARTPVPLAVGSLVLVVTVVVAGALTPDYDHRYDTVSRLASPGQPYAAVVRGTIVAVGALVLARAWVCRTVAAPGSPVVDRLVAAAGSAMVVAGIAPKDPPGVASTPASELHVAAAVCGVAALAVAMAHTAWRARRPAERRGSVAALALVAGLGATFPLAWGTAAYGLLQRAVLATALTWLVAVTWRPITAPGPSGGARRGRRPVPAPPG